MNMIEIALREINGKEIPAVTSLQVAQHFGKEHRNVLADIRNTVTKCSELFNALNFQPVDYTDAKGEKRPMYLLSKDGFMMVAMAYSVEKIATAEYPDGINAYHVDVIAAFRAELAQNPGMLDRYRKRQAA